MISAKCGAVRWPARSKLGQNFNNKVVAARHGSGGVIGRRGSSAVVMRSSVFEKGVGIMGHKCGMTQVFDDDGVSCVVTVIKICDGNVVTQVRSIESDGFEAVEVGYLPCQLWNTPTKSEIGHSRKAGLVGAAFTHLRQYRVRNASDYEVGQQLKAWEMFEPDDYIDTISRSKGKGFQGVVKRWGFKGGPASHGSHFHRAPGSVGASKTPGRIMPGKKMAGKMGNQKVRIQRLRVWSVDREKMVILGTIPGGKGGLVQILPSKITYRKRQGMNKRNQIKNKDARPEHAFRVWKPWKEHKKKIRF